MTARSMQPLIPEKGLFPTLVCDPDLAKAKQLAARLEALGFPTRVALRAEDALRLVKETHFRVILVVADLAAPDCLRFLSSVRRATPRTWLFVTNPKIDETFRQLVYRSGGDALIEFPIDVLGLVARLAVMQARARPFE
jgi:DNA-binding response OmpR family regulator